jgi:dihydrofolate reductase
VAPGEETVRRIVSSTYMTLDGVVQDPQDWPSGTHADDPHAGELQTELLLSADALLLGRATYEGFASFWAERSGDPFSDRINAIEKWVVARRPLAAHWDGAEVLPADWVEALRARKEAPGGAIVQFGYGHVTRTLIAEGLLDELRLWMHPFLWGRGGAEALLYRDGTRALLELADVTRLASGIVVLVYRRAVESTG